MKKTILLSMLLTCSMAKAQRIPFVYEQENTGSNVEVALPDVSELPVVESLTDPLMWSNGKGRVKSFAEWSKRRGEIAKEIQHYGIGVKPAVGEKVFLEMYWLDPVSGFTGQTTYDSKVCESEADAEAEGYVKRNKITMADIKPDSHVSECDVDFSTGSPVISFDTVCLGHSNVASSEAYLEEELPADAAALALTADAVIITAAVKKQIHFFNEVFMCITLRPAP